MAQNKGAIVRYRAIDRCLRSKHGKYGIEELRAACAEALYDAFSERMSVSRRQIYDDLNHMESNAGYRAEIEHYRDGKKMYYRYADPDFSIEKVPVTPEEMDQLPTTIRYIDMNPQRLATKRLMPGYFRVQEDIEIAGRTYRGIGNAALLQAAKYAPVHVRRTMIDEAMHGDNKRLRDYMNGCVVAARQGAVMVSPFISDKEKEVMIVLLAEEHPIIYIADNGFRDYYKPSDGLFDAVAAGRVLILSPWEYDPSKRHVTRPECVAMNQMAEEICHALSTHMEW